MTKRERDTETESFSSSCLLPDIPFRGYARLPPCSRCVHLLSLSIVIKGEKVLTHIMIMILNMDISYLIKGYSQVLFLLLLPMLPILASSVREARMRCT